MSSRVQEVKLEASVAFGAAHVRSTSELGMRFFSKQNTRASCKEEKGHRQINDGHRRQEAVPEIFEMSDLGFALLTKSRAGLQDLQLALTRKPGIDSVIGHPRNSWDSLGCHLARRGNYEDMRIKHQASCIMHHLFPDVHPAAS